MSKLEYMLNVNNWMDQYFVRSYQILCELHYSNQAIHYFIHQGMLSPNDSVVMEEINSSVFNITQETPSNKEKIVRTITLKDTLVYYMVQIISLHLIYCYHIRLLSSLMDCL